MALTRARRPAIAVTVFVAAVLILSPAPASAARQRALYWGAFIGPQLTGAQAPWDMSSVDRLSALVGKGLSIVAFGSPFADCSSSPCSFYPFPADAASNVREYGAIPALGWGSQSTPSSLDEPAFQLSDVIAGTYDSYLRTFAEGARDWGYPFFLRFDFEMNGEWFPWGVGVNGNQPGEFVAAWRHVHDVFTSVGATNATWVWCPYADAKHRHGPVGRFYPGDAYVDWTCLDGYNWAHNSVNHNPWRSFEKIFAPLYRGIVRTVAPGKPMMLGEIASNGPGAAKAVWIRRMFEALRGKFRRVRALVWFDEYDRGLQWPLETFPAARKAFSRGVRHGPFRANLFGGLGAGTIRPAG